MSEIFDGLRIESITANQARDRLGDQFQVKNAAIQQRVIAFKDFEKELGRDPDLALALYRSPFSTLAQRELAGPFDRLEICGGFTEVVEPPRPFRQFKKCEWICRLEVEWICLHPNPGELCIAEPRLAFDCRWVCRWVADSRTGG